ncbi:MAG: DeoR/GlpR transcriptional regulator [Candidatus Anammoximicrobium sp.]|nr:DeoR/GlpR transcriptional regulator [Candidatus Anammoximicrobium sp.]
MTRFETWNERRRQVNSAAKKRLAWFAAMRYFNDHGVTAVLGLGSQQTALAERLVELQRETRRPLDMTIMTNNEAIAAIIRAAGHEAADLFANTALLVSGGTFYPALEGYLGQLAADSIAWSGLTPDVTVVTSFGLDFGRGGVELSYKFETELGVQRALATRRTKRRIILADHSKVGPARHYRLGVNLESLCASAEVLTIILTRPSGYAPQFTAQVEAFLGGLTAIAAGPCPDALYGKDIQLVQIDPDSGCVRQESSLRQLQKARAVSRPRPPDSNWQFMRPADTHWFDSDGAGPISFDEAMSWVAQGGDPKGLHLGTYQTSQYTTLWEFLKSSHYVAQHELRHRTRGASSSAQDARVG